MNKKLVSVCALLFVFILLFVNPSMVLASVSNWQKSATIRPRSDNDFSSNTFKQSVTNVKNLGANYVTLVIPWYQSNRFTTDIQRGWNTPTDNSLVNAIQYIHSLGLKVTLTIHLETYDNYWRAEINPTDRATWFKNYENVLIHYANIAEQNNVELYVLGAEMIKMTSYLQNSSNTQYWRSMITKVRNIYSGPITYSAQRGHGHLNDWTNEQDTIQFWDMLDILGLSGYYELARNDYTPTQQDILEGWNVFESNHIKPFQQKFGKPLIFTEIGYRSVDGTNTDPWDWDRWGNYNGEIQAMMYDSLMKFWNNKEYFQGVHIWDWNSDPNYGGEGNTDYTPQNKPAELVIKEWFSSGTSTTPDPVEPTPTNNEFLMSTTKDISEPKVNQEIAFTSNVKPTNGITNAIVDVEIYNSNNQKVFQKFFEGQNLAANTDSTYNFKWTPTTVGEYTVMIGVFNNNWSQNYIWNSNVTKFSVSKLNEQPPAQAKYTISTGLDPVDAKVGQNLALTTSIASSVAVNDVIIDIEVYNSSNQRVLQKFYAGQNLNENPKNFDASFTPSSAGEYTVMVGVFNNNWSTNLVWNSNVKKFNVANPVVVTPVSNEITIQNPSDNSSVSGVFPLKALVSGRSLDTYNIQWKVDGGQLNNMINANDHKEAWIDVSGWSWNNNGPYKLTFVAKETNGNLIGEKTITISIVR